MKHDRLLQHIINFVGGRGQCSLDVINADMGSCFSLNKDTLESAILELDKLGLVILKGNNEVVLSRVGVLRYEGLRAGLERRYARKLEQKKEKSKEGQIRRKKLQSLEIHDNIKNKMGHLAFLLGKVYKPEYVLCDPVRVDIVWYDSSTSRFPSHAFEIQNHGESKNAIHNLEACKRYFPSCKVYLVVREEKEVKQIETLLASERNTISVLRAEQVERWLDCLTQIDKANRLRLLKQKNQKWFFKPVPSGIRQQVENTINELNTLGIYSETKVMNQAKMGSFGARNK
ncbi:MAG: hypothetical protein C4542_01265 [Dehalococcoidia bacterium]|nr:MAG: hypothetical protein C4542_01265 [Dehalococcoidia bacterium]